MCVSRLGRLLSAAVLSGAGAAGAATLESVNVTTIAALQRSNGSSTPLAASRDGRYALFRSEASNLLAAGDANRVSDLFLYDAHADSLERVDVGGDGAQADVPFSGRASVSDDGRYVFFGSSASNPAAGTGAGILQIYVRDRVAGTTQLVSRGNDGQPFSAAVTFVDASADARYVLLATGLPLVGTDANGRYDVYRLDRSTGEYALVSVGIDGQAGNRDTTTAQFSSDGRYVVFMSASGNLVAGDANNFHDLFLRDMDTSVTQIVTRMTNGQPLAVGDYAYLPFGNALSDDGRYVVFNSFSALDPADTNGAFDGYRFDRNDASVRRVTFRTDGSQVGNYGAEISSLSADGATVLVESADNITGATSFEGSARSYRVALGGSAVDELRVRPWSWGDTVDSCLFAGDAAGYCAFRSNSLYTFDHDVFTNVYRVDLAPAAARHVSRPAGSPVAYADHDSGYNAVSASADGRYVVFDSMADNLVVPDVNRRLDLFLRDRAAGTTTRIARRPDGAESWCNVGRSVISADGRYVAFDSCDALGSSTSTEYQAYRYDRVTGETVLVSRSAGGQAGNLSSIVGGISDDGSVVAFTSYATNLTSDAANLYGEHYVRDLVADTLTLISRRPGGAVRGGPSDIVRLSGDGRRVLFSHTSDDLVAGDTNGVADVFVFDRALDRLERVSVDAEGRQLSAASRANGISSDGRLVLFATVATELTGGSYFGHYVRDDGSGALQLVNRDSAGVPLQGFGRSLLSPDGNLVALIGAGDSDGISATLLDAPFVVDRRTGDIRRVTPPDANAHVGPVAFAADGRHLVFSSRATNLVADDGNSRFLDVFIAGDIGDVLFTDDFDDAR